MLRLSFIEFCIGNISHFLSAIHISLIQINNDGFLMKNSYENLDKNQLDIIATRSPNQPKESINIMKCFSSSQNPFLRYFNNYLRHLKQFHSERYNLAMNIKYFSTSCTKIEIPAQNVLKNNKIT